MTTEPFEHADKSWDWALAKIARLTKEVERLDRALALLRESERARTEVNGVCQWCAHAPYIVVGEVRYHAADCKLRALLEESDD